MPGAAQPARWSHPGRAALRTPRDHPNTQEIGPKQPIPPRSGPQHFHRPQPKQGSHVADPYHDVPRSAGPRKRGWLSLIALTASLLLRGHGWRGCLLPLTVLQHGAAFFSLISGKTPCLQDSSEPQSKLTHPQRVHPTGRSSWWVPALQKRCCSRLKGWKIASTTSTAASKDQGPQEPIRPGGGLEKPPSPKCLEYFKNWHLGYFSSTGFKVQEHPCANCFFVCFTKHAGVVTAPQV